MFLLNTTTNLEIKTVITYTIMSIKTIDIYVGYYAIRSIKTIVTETVGAQINTTRVVSDYVNKDKR